MFVILSALAFLQAASPSLPPSGDERETVIVAADGAVREAPPLNSRIRRERAPIQASDPVAAMMLREWANCIVRTRRRDALALLATPLNSAAQAEAIDGLTSRRFGWNTVCVRTRMMRVDNIVLRGAVAEALHRWEQRRGRAAGPLVPAPPPPAAANPRRRLVLAGRCLVEADAGAVAGLMEVRPDSNQSQDAVQALAPKLDECLPDNISAEDFHPLLIRGALGEPFYLASRELL